MGVGEMARLLWMRLQRRDARGRPLHEVSLYKGALALSYAKTGEHTKALKLREECVAKALEFLGLEHPHTQLCLDRVRDSYEHFKDHEAARKAGRGGAWPGDRVYLFDQGPRSNAAGGQVRTRGRSWARRTRAVGAWGESPGAWRLPWASLY